MVFFFLSSYMLSDSFNLFRSCLYLVYENSIVSWFEFVEDVGHGSYLNSNSFLFFSFRSFAKYWHQTGINLKLPSFLSHRLLFPLARSAYLFLLYLSIHTNNYYSQNIALILFIFRCITLSLPLPAHTSWSKKKKRRKKINDAGNLMKNKIQRCRNSEKKLTPATRNTVQFISGYSVTILYS